MLNRGFSVLKIECIQYQNHHISHNNVVIVCYELSLTDVKISSFHMLKQTYFAFTVKYIQHLNHHTYHMKVLHLVEFIQHLNHHTYTPTC